MAFRDPASEHPVRFRAAILTPLGRGAVATIGVEGDGVHELVSKYFQPAHRAAWERSQFGRILFGRWVREQGIAEEVVVARCSPTRIEIHCHGGRAAADSILESLCQAGASWIDSEVWLKQDVSDPIRADAQLMLMSTQTERTAAILLDQMRGGLRRELTTIVELLRSNDPTPARARLERLKDLAPVGSHLAEPWKVLFAGRPNVGKSSLVTAILGYERCIVLDQPGTTRDVVRGRTAIDGWPVELSDTAGLRESRDDIESAGIVLAQRHMQQADLVVWVGDVQQPEVPTPSEDSPPSLRIVNKCDLAPKKAAELRGSIATSATEGIGIETLLDAILTRLVAKVPRPGEAVPFTKEQQSAIKLAMEQTSEPEVAATHLSQLL